MAYKNIEDLRAWKRRDYAKKAEIYRARSRAWRAANSDKVKEMNKNTYAANREAYKAVRDAQPELHRIRNSKYRAEHPTEHAASQTKWAKSNPGKVNAACRKRQANKLQATPPWLTKQHLAGIEKFYVEAARLHAIDGIKRHVDHVYPLQSKTVCGLHVPWNLQILTVAENIKKGNKITGRSSVIS